MLRAARRNADLSQNELAARLGVDHSMISAYERGRRNPKVATLQRLLAAAGVELSGACQEASILLDQSIRRALDSAPLERVQDLGWVLGVIAEIFEGVPYAVSGLAAAVLQGAPVEVTNVDVRLADDDPVLAVVGARLERNSVRPWVPEFRRFAMAPPLHLALREFDPSRWRDPAGDQFQVTLVPAEEIDGAVPVPFGERVVPTVPLWDLEASDPEVARVLTRTREIVRERERERQRPAD